MEPCWNVGALANADPESEFNLLTNFAGKTSWHQRLIRWIQGKCALMGDASHPVWPPC